MNNVHDEMVAGRPQNRAERLDQAAIVAAALDIVRSRGIEALTMRTLTSDLGVSVGACYNHVRNRDELLDLVADEVLGQSPPLRAGVADPWAAITAHTIGIQELLDEYPGLDVVIMRRSSKLAVSKQIRADFVRSLERQGISSDDARHVQRSVTWLWLGARTSLGGRPQKPSERAQFARALNDLVTSLRRSLSVSDDLANVRTQGEPT